MKRIILLVLLLSLSLCGCGTAPAETVPSDSNPQISTGCTTSTQETTTGETTPAAVPGGENVYNETQLGWGSEVLFGTYEQDNNTGNGPEAIRWIVLESNDNGILLQSKYCLDAVPFAMESEEYVDWSFAYARQWLNEDFYQRAFSDAEHACILLTDVWNQEGDTQDHVFLLSAEEAEHYYALPWGTSGHFYDSDLRAKPTAYAIAQGIQVENGYSAWYLRSTGKFLGDWAGVSAEGSIGNWNLHWDEDSHKGWWGVRPVIWVSHNAEITLVQTSAADPDTDISRCFPEDWEGRYLIREGESCIQVYCKAAYESAESEKSWLFSVYYHKGELVLPDYYPLGTYDGYSVEATLPWDVPEFSNEAIGAEYIDMIYQVGNVFLALQDRLAELEHYRQLEDYGFDLSRYMGDTSYLAGVYRLDSHEWTEESRAELISETNPHSFISIDPDGHLFISYGRDVYTGSIQVLTDRGAQDQGEPFALVILQDNIVRPAYCDQGVLTIQNMPQYDRSEPTSGGDTTGTSWTYIWESDAYWTGNPYQGDIG